MFGPGFQKWGLVFLFELGVALQTAIIKGDVFCSIFAVTVSVFTIYLRSLHRWSMIFSVSRKVLEKRHTYCKFSKGDICTRTNLHEGECRSRMCTRTLGMYMYVTSTPQTSCCWMLNYAYTTTLNTYMVSCLSTACRSNESTSTLRGIGIVY